MSLLREFQKSVLPVQDKLYRFALRILGSAEDAEDVVQDVLMKIWNQGSDLGEKVNVEAWCMRMAKNLSLDRLKSGHRRFQQQMEVLPEAHDPQLTPDRITEQAELMKRIHQLIAQLPEKQRMVIQLRDIEGHSYQEIADMIEISLDQVKVNLFRARKQLRKQLQLTESYGT